MNCDQDHLQDLRITSLFKLMSHYGTLRVLNSRTQNEELNSTFQGVIHQILELHEDGIDLSALYSNYDDKRFTLATMAAKAGLDDVIKVLARAGVNLNDPDGNGYTPATMAAKEGYADVIVSLARAGVNLNDPDGNGYTPATMAAKTGNYVDAVIDALAREGVDFNAYDKNGHTPATMAAWRCGNRITISLTEKEIPASWRDTVGALKKAGADFEAPNPYKNRLTPATIAAATGTTTAIYFIRALARAGIDLEARDGNGETPLEVAVAERRNSIAEAIRELISKKAEPTADAPEPLQQ